MEYPAANTIQPTFGNVLRGYRLGFAWSSILGAMVRLRPEGDHFVVTMCPPNMIPSGKDRDKTEHYIWWEEPDILGRSRAIAERSNPKSLIQFSIDVDGEELR